MGVAEDALKAHARPGQSLDAQRLWADALEFVRPQVTRDGFETWLAPTRGIRAEGGALLVEVPNLFCADWLEQHYTTQIRDALARVTGSSWLLSFQAKDASSRRAVVQRDPGRRAASRSDSYRIQPRYTFDAFVVGEANRFAHAAARSVAQNPGCSYNPLFLYGGVGLGKTHLVQAIGNLALATRPGIKVLYVAAERLFLELIQAIEKNTRIAFKNRYRELDLLLMDDVHYLVGKERLQEEVFYIFNSLHEAGSQIVFTSDRPPRDIPTLEERLVSRLGAGLVVDIQPPDIETRIAILKQKATLENVDLPDDVAYYVASRVRTSVRELEASLVRLMALSSLTSKDLTLELAAKSLHDIALPEEPVDQQRIVNACAESFGVGMSEVKGTGRTKQVALARQTAMYLLRASLRFSYKEIGTMFGGKDHTTVMHAVKQIERLRSGDSAFAARLDRITRLVHGG